MSSKALSEGVISKCECHACIFFRHGRGGEAGEMIPLTQEELGRIREYDCERRALALQIIQIQATESRLAREFWERCVLAIPREGFTYVESLALEADKYLDEWRKRFDPPKETP